jgi:hypothetical protein
MNVQPPPWFKGNMHRARNDEKMARTCRVCGAPPGEKCRYMTSSSSHREAGQYVENVVGEQMIRPHRQR